MYWEHKYSFIYLMLFILNAIISSLLHILHLLPIFIYFFHLYNFLIFLYKILSFSVHTIANKN